MSVSACGGGGGDRGGIAPFESLRWVVVADLGGDGRPDLLVGPMGASQGRLAWLRQDPAQPGTLLAPVLLP